MVSWPMVFVAAAINLAFYGYGYYCGRRYK